jgi:hypothetical protein
MPGRSSDCERRRQGRAPNPIRRMRDGIARHRPPHPRAADSGERPRQLPAIVLVQSQIDQDRSVEIGLSEGDPFFTLCFLIVGNVPASISTICPRQMWRVLCSQSHCKEGMR